MPTDLIVYLCVVLPTFFVSFKLMTKWDEPLSSGKPYDTGDVVGYAGLALCAGILWPVVVALTVLYFLFVPGLKRLANGPKSRKKVS